MLMTHTRTQMTAMALDRKLPNSSSFFLRGDSSSSWLAMAWWILPMAVWGPVPTTTHRARPAVTTVPCRRPPAPSWAGTPHGAGSKVALPAVPGAPTFCARL